MNSDPRTDRLIILDPRLDPIFISDPTPDPYILLDPVPNPKILCFCSFNNTKLGLDIIASNSLKICFLGAGSKHATTIQVLGTNSRFMAMLVTEIITYHSCWSHCKKWLWGDNPSSYVKQRGPKLYLTKTNHIDFLQVDCMKPPVSKGGKRKLQKREAWADSKWSLSTKAWSTKSLLGVPAKGLWGTPN